MCSFRSDGHLNYEHTVRTRRQLTVFSIGFVDIAIYWGPHTHTIIFLDSTNWLLCVFSPVLFGNFEDKLFTFFNYTREIFSLSLSLLPVLSAIYVRQTARMQNERYSREEKKEEGETKKPSKREKICIITLTQLIKE